MLSYPFKKHSAILSRQALPNSFQSVIIILSSQTLSSFPVSLYDSVQPGICHPFQPTFASLSILIYTTFPVRFCLYLRIRFHHLSSKKKTLHRSLVLYLVCQSLKAFTRKHKLLKTRKCSCYCLTVHFNLNNLVSSQVLPSSSNKISCIFLAKKLFTAH
jgi:hypothetical protein